MISQKENVRVDFKADATEYVLRGLSTDIASFANTQGGIIVFGVTDEGDPVGCKLTQGQRDRISQEASKCHPVISIDLEEVSFGARKFMLVKVPKSTVIHNDYQRKFPVRVGNITDYLDSLGLILLLQERGLSKGTLAQVQQQSRTTRELLPEDNSSMIISALRSTDNTLRIEALKDLSSLPYRHVLLEGEAMADAIGHFLVGADAAEVSLVLDVLRAIANVGSDKEKSILRAWIPRITEFATTFKSPDTARKGIDVLQFIRSKSAVDAVVKWILEADDSSYSELQISNVLANFGYFGLKEKARATIYELLEKQTGEKTRKRCLEVLEILRRSGW